MKIPFSTYTSETNLGSKLWNESFYPTICGAGIDWDSKDGFIKYGSIV